jgi:branched-chain amino acid transport system substrate-binding protein
MEDDLKVGVVLPFSGPLKQYSDDVMAGIEIALDELSYVNPDVHKRITVVRSDDAGNSEQAYERAKELYGEEHVHAIIGSLTSLSSFAINKASIEEGKILINPTSGVPEVIKDNPHGYLTSLGSIRLAQILAQFTAQNLHKKRALILTADGNYLSLKAAKAFEEGFQDAGGKVVGQISYHLAQPDTLANIATQAKRTEADVLVALDDYAVVGTLIKSLRRTGVRLPFVGTDNWDSKNFLEIAGLESGTGHFFLTHFSPQDPGREVRDFVGRYQSKGKGDPSSLVAMGYDAMKVLYEAFIRSKSNRSLVLAKTLEQAGGFTSLGGTLTFDKDHAALKSASVMATSGSGFRFITRVAP